MAILVQLPSGSIIRGCLLEKNIGKTHVITPAPRDVWERICSIDPNCLIFQTPAWTDAICSTGDYEDASRLYETASGRRWVLPLLRKKAAHPALTSQASLPAGWGLGGVLSNRPLNREMIDTVFADLLQQPSLRMLIRPNPLASAAWEAAKPRGTTTLAFTSHILDISAGFEEVWKKRFHHPTRTSIRKAERAGLTIEMDPSGQLLPAYYDIFTHWSMRRGRERHLPGVYTQWMLHRRDPYARLEKMVRYSSGAGRVYVARNGTRPIAAAILFIYNQNAVYLRGTSIREEAGPLRANDLLQCQMIRDACEAGCRYYHMGTSAGVESLMRFKHSFGAEPVDLYNYSLERLPISHLVGMRDSLMRSLENQLIRIKI